MTVIKLFRKKSDKKTLCVCAHKFFFKAVMILNKEYKNKTKKKIKTTRTKDALKTKSKQGVG